jgi:hypothetical protein
MREPLDLLARRGRRALAARFVDALEDFAGRLAADRAA